VLAGWPAADAAPASLDETPFPGRGLVSTANGECINYVDASSPLLENSP